MVKILRGDHWHNTAKLIQKNTKLIQNYYKKTYAQFIVDNP